jgi:drug/metabolite transporter (DMT)-like permease
MFFSEMIGLPLSCLFSNKSKKEEDSEQESINEENQDKYEDTSDTEIRNKKAKKYLLIIIPFLLDTIVTFLSNVSLDYLPGSIHSVIKQMALIIFTLLLSKFCLKNKHIIDHYISIPIIIIGSVFVGLSIGFNSIKEFEPKDIIIGLVLLLISILLQSIQMIFEEYYIRKYNNNQFFY